MQKKSFKINWVPTYIEPGKMHNGGAHRTEKIHPSRWGFTCFVSYKPWLLHLMLGTLYAAVFYGADRRGIQLKFGASQMPAIDAVFEANRAHVFSRTTHL